MRKLYFLLLSFFVSYSLNAATANYIFLNNNIDAGTVDLEIKVNGPDTVYKRINGINYLKATANITVPSSVLLTINVYNTGTSVAFYTMTNHVFNDNTFQVGTLYGTSLSLGYIEKTAYTQASTGTNIKYDVMNSTPNLQEINVNQRGGSALATNLSYGTATFTFSNEVTAASMILDVTPYNASTDLFSYQLSADTLGGQYIFLFTAGTSSALTMYMLQMNGTVTMLPSEAVTGILGGQSSTALNIYPNPATDVLSITCPSSGSYNLEVRDMKGTLITATSIESNGQDALVNVASLPEGLFVVSLSNGSAVYTSKLNIKH